MGACASGGHSREEIKVQTLVKIQALVRTFLAKRRLGRIRTDKLKAIFSIYLSSNFTGAERARTESFITGDPLRAQLMQRPFILTEDQILKVINDGTKRVYIDCFQEVGDGKKYKGQW